MGVFCDRVAALAAAIGRRLALPARSLELLKQAAGLHHAPALVLHAAALDRLLANLLRYTDIGAGVLRAWRFPDHLVEAVRFHHRPADSVSDLACVVYLAQYWLESDEEVPVSRHFEVALERTHLSLEELARSQHRDVSLERVLNVA